MMGEETFQVFGGDKLTVLHDTGLAQLVYFKFWTPTPGEASPLRRRVSCALTPTELDGLIAHLQEVRGEMATADEDGEAAA